MEGVYDKVTLSAKNAIFKCNAYGLQIREEPPGLKPCWVIQILPLREMYMENNGNKKRYSKQPSSQFFPL